MDWLLGQNYQQSYIHSSKKIWEKFKSLDNKGVLPSRLLARAVSHCLMPMCVRVFHACAVKLGHSPRVRRANILQTGFPLDNFIFESNKIDTCPKGYVLQFKGGKDCRLWNYSSHACGPGGHPGWAESGYLDLGSFTPGKCLPLISFSVSNFFSQQIFKYFSCQVSSHEKWWFIAFEWLLKKQLYEAK